MTNNESINYQRNRKSSGIVYYFSDSMEEITFEMF